MIIIGGLFNYSNIRIKDKEKFSRKKEAQESDKKTNEIKEAVVLCLEVLQIRFKKKTEEKKSTKKFKFIGSILIFK